MSIDSFTDLGERIPQKWKKVPIAIDDGDFENPMPIARIVMHEDHDGRRLLVIHTKRFNKRNLPAEKIEPKHEPAK